MSEGVACCLNLTDETLWIQSDTREPGGEFVKLTKL